MVFLQGVRCRNPIKDIQPEIDRRTPRTDLLRRDRMGVDDLAT